MAEAAVRHVAGLATVVRPTDPVAVVTDDPDDDRVLEAAYAGTADVIVSGDRHLLHLGSWREIRIEKVSAFLERAI